MRKARWIFDYVTYSVVFLLKGCVIITAILALAWFAASAIHMSRMVYATPETQSAFFKSFSDQDILDKVDANQGSFTDGDLGGSAGQGVATNTRTLSTTLHIYDVDRASILPELASRVESTLKATHAQLISTTVDKDGMLEYKYASGPTEGRVTIFAPSYIPAALLMNPKIAARFAPMSTVKVRIEETWYKSRAGKSNPS